MSVINTGNSVIEVNRDSLEEAVEVLTLAFENDPCGSDMLYREQSGYLDKVREIFRFTCLARIELGIPCIGTIRDSRITGIACISVPEKQKWPDSLTAASERMNSVIGRESSNRLKRFTELSNNYAPAEPHHYLAALGVHPEYQGQGFGRMLLDKVREIAENHPTSAGVYLDTARLKNVRLYEYFGYKQAGKDKLDGAVDLWYMFRENKM